jgi:hypothetical protein
MEQERSDRFFIELDYDFIPEKFTGSVKMKKK